MDEQLLNEVLRAFFCPPEPGRMPGTTLEDALALAPRVLAADFVQAAHALERRGLLERVGTRRYDVTLAGEKRLAELGT